MAILTGTREQIIEKAKSKLCAGELIAIPTETVYGLGGNISIDGAVKKIYEFKNRPTNHPLIIHIASIEDLYIYATKIPKYVEILAKKFWPGPLTFILPKSDKVSSLVTGGQDTVAIRMPKHDLTLELIKAVGHPLAAPSANKFMSISPTRPEHVIAEFNNAIDVIDGGICNVGIESTIIDATSENYYKVLRPGIITEEDLNEALDNKYKATPITKRSDIVAPGSHKKHYSPQKKLVKFNSKEELDSLFEKYSNIYIIHYSNFKLANKEFSYKISKNPNEFAKDLYHALRLGDNSFSEIIAIEFPPEEYKWGAILDRLKRSLGS